MSWVKPVVKKMFSTTTKPLLDDTEAAGAAFLTLVFLGTLPYHWPFSLAIFVLACVYEVSYWLVRLLMLIQERNRKARAKAEAAAVEAIPVETVPPPVAKTVDELLGEAEAAFQKEMAMIDRLPLPDDEKDVVRENAKNKYLEKVEQIVG
jgi:hypothetical protein